MEYKDLPGYERLPEYHMRSPETKAIVEVTTNAALKARADSEDAINQMFVGSATWGLELWEQLMGITPDPGESEAGRRAAIVAKMMGSGTCNAAMIAALAKSVTGYEGVVEELFSQYTFRLSFAGEAAGLLDVDRALIERIIEEVKPAHLKFEFAPVTWGMLADLYETWGDLMDLGMTWAQIAQKVPVARLENNP